MRSITTSYKLILIAALIVLTIVGVVHFSGSGNYAAFSFWLAASLMAAASMLSIIFINKHISKVSELEWVNSQLVNSLDEARQREERMRIVLDTAGDSIITVDETYTVIAVNHSTERLFGYLEFEMTGMPLKNLIDPQSWENLTAAFHEVESIQIKNKQACFTKISGQNKSGLDVRLEATISTSVIAGSRIYTVIFRDLTERDMMEMQLRHAQKMESIGQLAAGIAHEINTPIQFIGDNTRFLLDEFNSMIEIVKNCDLLIKSFYEPSSIEILKDTDLLIRNSDLKYLENEIPLAINQSLEGVTRVTKIVRAMKEFSHPGNIEKQAIDLNKSIESTVVVSTNEWKFVADINTDFDTSLPLVSCLPGEINQVILNLIINAAHAIAEKQGRHPEQKGLITIVTKNLSTDAEIRITDTGCGIPHEIAQKVFDPFFTTKTVGKGTGQGLAIAHSIICDKHGGSIRFETEVGMGTVFIITLPIRKDDVKSEADEGDLQYA